MAVVNGIHKLSNAVNSLCGVLCVIMVAAMVLTTGAQIIFRLFFKALTWSEELTRYLLVWSTFIGGGIVYKSGGHIAVTILQGLCPEKVQRVLQILVHIVCGVFATVAVVFGFRYMIMQGNQLSAAMRIPMRLMYLAIPVGCLVIDLHAVDAILQILFHPEKAEEVTA